MIELELTSQELREKAIEVLYRELGAKDACRVLGMPYCEGNGNYTEDRQKRIGNTTREMLIAEIKAHRESTKITSETPPV